MLTCIHIDGSLQTNQFGFGQGLQARALTWLHSSLGNMYTRRSHLCLHTWSGIYFAAYKNDSRTIDLHKPSSLPLLYHRIFYRNHHGTGTYTSYRHTFCPDHRNCHSKYNKVDRPYVLSRNVCRNYTQHTQ